MTKTRLVVLLIMLFSYLSTAFSQSDTDIAILKVNVTAGDTFELTIGPLDPPLACDTYVWINFGLAANGFTIGNQARKGDTSVHAKLDLPKDLPGGDYVSSAVRTNPCPGYINGTDFPAPKRTVTVKALAGSAPTTKPKTAEIAFTVTQKQFFETKAADLDDLEDRLATRLAANSVDNDDLKKFLIEILTEAQAALSTTEIQYRKFVMKPGDKLPAFFGDFHYQYNARIDELRAELEKISGPMPVFHRAVLLESAQASRQPTTPMPPRKSVGIFPQNAITVKDLLQDNATAFRYVSKNDRITFDIGFKSTPQGAHIFYKKMIDDVYMDYPGLTDVEHAKFDLATTDFLFRRDGCKDEVKYQINPYQGPDDPVLPVVFHRCKGR